MSAHPQHHDATQLMIAARSGDSASQQAMLQHWAAPVYRVCLRLLGNPADAEDASQDALVKVLRSLDAYDERRSPRAWVFQIARNTCIDLLRKRGTHTLDITEDLPSLAPSPVQALSTAERAIRVHRAVAELPLAYREVVVLYHFEHLQYAEIAAVLELPMGTVMNRLFRARKRLAALLPDDGGTP